MRVLIACEYSGIVRDAFIKAGYDAISCDLLPTESPGPHYQGNVFDIINSGFDLMIAHPPCRYLSYAGIKYWNTPYRSALRNDATLFFLNLFYCEIPHVCIENPVGYINTIFKETNQLINPYYFGDNEQKKTMLWLRNLPKLVHVKSSDMFFNKTHTIKPEPKHIDKSGKKRYFTDAISGFSKEAAKKRAKFFPGIAAAMAEQWGTFVKNNINKNAA